MVYYLKYLLNFTGTCSYTFFRRRRIPTWIGTGPFYCFSQPAVSKCICAICEGLSNIAGQWIRFPRTVAQRDKIQQKFQETIRVPGIIGTKDCTHISIVPPKVHEEVYNNLHHGHHSLNVKMICDRDLRVLNLSARYPGRTNDHFIWRHSQARTEMQKLSTNRIGEFYLIGDSGYAAEPWLQTPILRAEEETPEQQYTTEHCSSRNCIERCFGVLKARWRCLRRDRVLHYAPAEACLIVQTCCSTQYDDSSQDSFD